MEREKVKNRRNSSFLEFDEVKTIALINQGESDVYRWEVQHKLFDLFNKFGKQIFMFTYFDEKMIPEHVKELHQRIITPKDVNWYGVLSKQIQNEVANQKFDLIIDLTKMSKSSTMHLLTIVNARMRIGKNEERFQPFFDLLIDWKEDESLNDFIDHIIYYLKILKKSTK